MDDIWTVVPVKLQELSLFLNENKSYTICSEELKSKAKQLVYLGYCFSHKKDNISTDISPLKVDKIKTRIVKAFINVAKNGDVKLLVDRIKYLTGNYSIKSKMTLLPVKAGIYYNYKRIDINSMALNELDRFYQNILHSYHSKLGLKLSATLTDSDRKLLKKYSFKYGFLHHTYHSFTPDRIHQIKKCWL